MGSKFMANCDSDGCGPEGRFYMGKKVMYPTDALVKWLRARATV